MSAEKKILLFFLEDQKLIHNRKDVTYEQLEQMNTHARSSFARKLHKECLDYYYTPFKNSTNNDETETNKEFVDWLFSQDPFFSAFVKHVRAYYEVDRKKYKLMPSLLAEFWKKNGSNGLIKCPEIFNGSFLRKLTIEARNGAIVRFINNSDHQLYKRYKISLSASEIDITAEKNNEKKRKKEDIEKEWLPKGNEKKEQPTSPKKIKSSKAVDELNSRPLKKRPSGEFDTFPKANSNTPHSSNSNNQQKTETQQLQLKLFGVNAHNTVLKAQINSLKAEKIQLRADFNAYRKITEQLQLQYAKTISELEETNATIKQEQTTAKSTQQKLEQKITTAIVMLQQANPNDTHTLTVVQNVMRYLGGNEKSFDKTPPNNNSGYSPAFYSSNNSLPIQSNRQPNHGRNDRHDDRYEKRRDNRERDNRSPRGGRNNSNNVNQRRGSYYNNNSNSNWPPMNNNNNRGSWGGGY